MPKFFSGTLNGVPFTLLMKSIRLIAPNTRLEIEGKTLIWGDFTVYPGEFFVACDQEYPEVLKSVFGVDHA